MQFCWVTLHVNNMERSIWFYHEMLGLPLNRTFSPAPGSQIVFLGSGETQVELIRDEQQPPASFSQNISLGFKVESLEKTMERLNANGIPVHAGPFQPNPGIRFFYVLDPNGLKVQFVEEARQG